MYDELALDAGARSANNVADDGVAAEDDHRV
jgi:hypothetical protein